jgi:hypothetical protein
VLSNGGSVVSLGLEQLWFPAARVELKTDKGRYSRLDAGAEMVEVC